MTDIVFKRGDEVELGHRLLEALDANDKNLIADEDALYHYQQGLWHLVSRHEMSRILQSFAGGRMIGTGKRLKVNANTIKGAIEVALDKVAEPGFFSAAPLGLTFTNGFLTVGAGGVDLQPHAREQRQREGYPFKWEDAVSPEFETFAASFFKGDEDAAEKVAFVQELFGASLVGAATRFQRCALLIGDGENGKDTFIDVLKSVFPEKLVASVAPHKWDAEYSRAALAGKRLNVIGELPKKELDASESFKAFVTGSRVDARVAYGRVFFYTPGAGHVFAANAVMGTSDFSHGFYRRFGIVRFNRIFEAHERDVGIRDRLIAAGLQPIVAWLVRGAEALLRRNAFILPASHFVELNVWRLSVDPVATFFEGLNPGGETQAMRLFDEYRHWCERNGHRACSNTKFGLRIKALLREKKWPAPRRLAEGFVYPVTSRRQVEGAPTPEILNNVIPFKGLV